MWFVNGCEVVGVTYDFLPLNEARENAHFPKSFRGGRPAQLHIEGCMERCLSSGVNSRDPVSGADLVSLHSLDATCSSVFGSSVKIDP